MRAVLVVVANILGEQAFQAAFVNCDDVIQEITAATPYPMLCDSISAKDFRTKCGQDSHSGIEPHLAWWLDRSANKQDNELKQQLRCPPRRATELATSNRTCVRSAIVDGLESRQRTIRFPWSSDGSALESRLGSCPI